MSTVYDLVEMVYQLRLSGSVSVSQRTQFLQTSHYSLNKVKTVRKQSFRVRVSKQITFPNKQGEKLSGIFEDNAGDKAVVLCHGFNANKNAFRLPEIAELLRKQGYSSLRFDFSDLQYRKWGK